MNERADERNGEASTVRVWDPLVRVFHWSLVVAFVVAYLSSEEGEALHLVAGYAVLALVAVRLVWGFVGTRHARFNDFVYPPRAVLAYLRGVASGNPPHYRGHNPAGGWMVLALLLGLIAISVSGVMLDAAEEGGLIAAAGPGVSLVSEARADDDHEDESEGDEDEHEAYASSESEGGEEIWEEVHEASVNLTLVLIVLHIAGVLVSGRMHGENLIRAMVTGRKAR